MSTLRSSELIGLINRVLQDTGRLRKDNNLQVKCPFCHHRKQKLEIHLDPPYEFHCWVCNIRGRGLYWLFKKLNCSQDLIFKLENIIGTYSYLPRAEDSAFLDRIATLRCTDFPPPPKSILNLPIEFKSLADTDGSIEYKIASKYARRRKLTNCDIIKYNIGYCSAGRFGERLIFPSYDADNDLNFFSCRSYYEHGYKYLNSDSSRNIIGFENMIDFDFPIYLCEGALDAISLKRNAVPLFGKTMSRKLKSAIMLNKCPEINVVLDDDALESAIKIVEFCHSVGKTVKLIRLTGKDPNVLGFVKTVEQIKNTDHLDFGMLMKFKLGI